MEARRGTRGLGTERKRETFVYAKARIIDGLESRSLTAGIFMETTFAAILSGERAAAEVVEIDVGVEYVTPIVVAEVGGGVATEMRRRRRR